MCLLLHQTFGQAHGVAVFVALKNAGWATPIRYGVFDCEQPANSIVVCRPLFEPAVATQVEVPWTAIWWIDAVHVTPWFQS
jgi:hypothetical protein